LNLEKEVVMSTITVKVPDTMSGALEAEAKKRQTSKSEVVRYCIETVLSGKQVKESPSFYDLTKDLCGKFKGGPSDAATNPKYMEGFGL
jgi:hypothetical protein